MKIAINGFGRTGRNIFKIALQRSGMDVVAINDTADPVILAHLLKHDSIYGIYNRSVNLDGNALKVDDIKVPMSSQPEPKQLSWPDVDLVIESAGNTMSVRDHLVVGAKKVILTESGEDVDQTIVCAVNDDDIKDEAMVFSTAGTAASSICPVIKILDEHFSLAEGFAHIIGAYDGHQVIQDRPNRDIRQSRAAGYNIIPLSSDLISDMNTVLPSLKGRLNASAMSVPVHSSCLASLVLRFSDKTCVNDINKTLQDAAESYPGIIGYSTAALVSSDVRGSSHSCIIDSTLTAECSDGLVNIVLWYDNEFGYASRVLDLARKIIQID